MDTSFAVPNAQRRGWFVRVRPRRSVATWTLIWFGLVLCHAKVKAEPDAGAAIGGGAPAVEYSVQDSSVVLRIGATEFVFGGGDARPSLTLVAEQSSAVPLVRILDCSSTNGLTVTPRIGVMWTPLMQILEMFPGIRSPYSLEWEVRIFDAGGNRIRTIRQLVRVQRPFETERIPGAPFPLDRYAVLSPEITWDGRDDGGNVVPPSAFTFQVVASSVRTVAFGLWDVRWRQGTVAADCGVLSNDTTAPILAIQSPWDASTEHTPTPEFVVAYVDHGSGVRLGSFRALVDGVDRTSSFQVGGFRATWTPSVGQSLADGAHQFTASIEDGAGNATSASIGFRTLGIPLVASPDVGDVPLDVDFEVSPADPTNAVRFEWDFDGDGKVDETTVRPRTSFTFESPGLFGTKVRVVYANSRPSNSGEAVVAAHNPGIEAEIGAFPRRGPAPLSVLLTPGGNSTIGVINGYRWDFEGDGIIDTPEWSRLPANQMFVYSHEGTYNATLYVRDDEGNLTKKSVEIVVTPSLPELSALAVPSNGSAPLPVEFTVFGASPGGPIVMVEFEFGDGTRRDVFPALGVFRHTYRIPGSYDTSVTLTDLSGKVYVLDDPLFDVRVGGSGVPLARLEASPMSGPFPLVVDLAASSSTDPDGVILEYEWDFDLVDAGSFQADEITRVPTTTHVYESPGRYRAGVRVRDDDGNTAVDLVEVVALEEVEISVSNDTIDPYNGALASVAPRTSTVSTSLTGAHAVRVHITDRSGRIVRTLFDGRRGSGVHADVWDGRDDDGLVVLDGDYYAFVEYEDGAIVRTEPSEVTGGGVGFVSDYQNVSGGGAIDPWNNEFWEMTFSTTRDERGASEVSVFITPFQNVVDIAAIPLNRAVFGTGTYTTYWEGLRGNGRYVPDRGQRNASGDGYLWSAQAWRLPDNAIVVEGGRPRITDPAASLNFYDPTTYFCLTREQNGIEFTLSRPAVVEVKVVNMETGRTLRTIVSSLLAEGGHVIEWDGRSDSGRYVATGPYRIEMTARSQEGNVSYVRRVLVFVQH